MAAEGPQLGYLGIEHGLSNNAVTTVYQDSYGFMWFGTYDGLNRFDGYNFKVFRNRLNDSTSLANNWIVAISEDSKHNILVGTKQGADLYDPVTGKFSFITFYADAERLPRKAVKAINGFETDAKKNVFIATAGSGLLLYQTAGKPARQIPLLSAGTKRFDYHVQSIKIDAKQRLWLFVQGFGLCLYDYAGSTVRQVDLTTRVAKCIQPDNLGNIWIGNEYGLYRYAIATRSVKAYHEADGFLSHDNVHGLTLDKKGLLWISTDGGGITVLDTRTGKQSYILPGKEKGRLSSGAVNTVYEDKDNRKWIGTLRGGINILDARKNRFITIAHDPLKSNSLSSNFILSFCEDENGDILIGTDGEGLSYWKRKENTFSNLSHSIRRSGSISNNNVAGIIRDSGNAIWITTYGGGVNKFNKEAGTFKHYLLKNTATNNTDQNAWAIFEDRSKNIWVGTCTGGGLYRYDRQADRFQLFDKDLGDVISMAEDSNGNLWAGTFSSLIRVDRNGSDHQIYRLNRAVRSVYIDAQNRFWVGTEGGGLLLFNRSTGKYRTFTEENGLPGNAVLNILEDDASNLWLSTFTGLSRFNPLTEQFKNFYESDGLQSNQFNYNAALKLSNGEMLFGGIKGFNLFRPSGIRPFTNTPKLLITGLRTNNIAYEQDETFEGKTNVYEVKQLTLPYDKAVLSVDFAALEYSSPDKISYSYYLEGWDKGWNAAGRSRTINYSRLREGGYKLHIRSTNAEGVWLPGERLLALTVLPPFWRSWWAYCFYGISLISALYVYTLYHKRQTWLNYQIQLANLKVAQEKELNEKKLSFFTHISHEFRTPLTLIINPIKEFLNSSHGQVDPKELIVVYRNARRLLSLVDQLLIFRKSDSENLKIVRFNLVTFAKEVYMCFGQQAVAQKIDFKFGASAEAIDVYGDKEKLEIALFNLVSNAFKFTPEGGTIKLTIAEHDSAIELHVTDTGPGIPAEVGDKLFKKFYQAMEQGQTGKAGFGIGLYLVKKFVETHSGTVSYSTAKGGGTDFMICLLKGRSHFSAHTIYEDRGEAPVFLEELVSGHYDQDRPEEGSDEGSLELLTEKQSILIVDDNSEIRNYVIHLFSKAYTVYQAASGEEGLLLALKHTPDIIITDVVMGMMSGVELCSEIKSNPALSHIPVILLTSISSAEVKLKGIEGGADDYITKPFDNDILTARVINLLKSRNTLQKYFYNEITLRADDSKVSGEFKEFLEKCIAITEKHLENPDFNIKTLADEIGMSHSVLYKRVKSISGRTVNEFIRYIRLRKAAELLANSDHNINEVAFHAGFSDMKYFREQFAKLFGMRPSEYIRKYRRSFNKSYRINDRVLKS